MRTDAVFFFDAVLLAIAFLVPGFVWEGVRQFFVRRREDRAHQAWIRVLTLSAFNYGLWSWLVYLLLMRVEGLAHPWVAALAWSCVLFVSPAVLGVVTGLLGSRAIVMSRPEGYQPSEGPSPQALANPPRGGSSIRPPAFPRK